MEYQKNGENYIVWFEDVRSVVERVELAVELGVRGVAFWRLGGEDEGVWDKLREIKEMPQD